MACYTLQMEQSAKNQLLLEKAGFASVGGVLCALFLLLEFLPQNQRGLLLKDDPRAQAKAFTAVVAPLGAEESRLEGGALNHLADVSRNVRNRNRAGVRGPNGQQVFADAGPSPVPNGVPAGPSANLSDSGAPASSGGLGQNPFTGLSVPGQPGPLGAAPAASTTSSSSGGGTTSSSGGTTSSTGGTTSSTGGTTSSAGGTTTPVSSVPEPGTWLTMLVGFFMIGGVIRRRPRSLQAV
jgi:hypothetical protein